MFLLKLNPYKETFQKSLKEVSCNISIIFNTSFQKTFRKRLLGGSKNLS